MTPKLPVLRQLSLIAITLLGSLASAAPPGPTPAGDFAPATVLVAFQPGTPGAEVSAAHRQAGGQLVKTLGPLGVDVVAVASGTVLTAVQKYQQNPNVKFAEPSYLRPLFLPVTNEGSEPTLGITNNFTEQWGLHNTGQSFGATVDPLFGTLTAPAYEGDRGRGYRCTRRVGDHQRR